MDAARGAFLVSDGLLIIRHRSHSSGERELTLERLDLGQGNPGAFLHLHPFLMRAGKPIKALNEKHVGSNSRNVFQKSPVQAGDRGRHECHGNDSDDNAECGENGAQLVSANGSPGDT